MYNCNTMIKLIGGRKQNNTEIYEKYNRKIKLWEIYKKIRISWKKDMRNLSNNYKIINKLILIEVIFKLIIYKNNKKYTKIYNSTNKNVINYKIWQDLI